MQYVHKTQKPKTNTSSSVHHSSNSSSSHHNNAHINMIQPEKNRYSGTAKIDGEGLINFAPYCTISSGNSSAQPADVLILAPIASHRRARNPAWSHLFYPNEPHVDLLITLPTAILLREIHLQPHIPSLAACPSAVAIEISRDSSLPPIPISHPICTIGLTNIRLKLSQPEIATSIVLRLYR